MSKLQDEIYREKYLKYKQKYLTALENMKGGFIDLPIEEKSKVIFCPKETYDRLQRSGRNDELILTTFGGDNCFFERLKNPYQSLMLENNILKKVGDREYQIPNYPILCGRKFGIKEEPIDLQNLFDKTKIKESKFNNDFAMMQLKNAQPIIKKILENLNKTTFSEVYLLHIINEKKVSYNGVLEYVAFPSFSNYLEQLKPQQKGGGDVYFYFCNSAASHSINEFYFKNSDSPVEIKNKKCLHDIALDTLARREPKIGYIKAKENIFKLITNRDQIKSEKYNSLELPFKFGVEGKVYNETNITTQLQTENAKEFFSRQGFRIKDYVIYKLDDNGLLSKFNNKPTESPNYERNLFNKEDTPRSSSPPNKPLPAIPQKDSMSPRSSSPSNKTPPPLPPKRNIPKEIELSDSEIAEQNLFD
jgi:hypothetical protein